MRMHDARPPGNLRRQRRHEPTPARLPQTPGLARAVAWIEARRPNHRPIFAHLHNSRLVWLKHSAPYLKCPVPLDPRRCTLSRAAAAIQKVPPSVSACFPMPSPAHPGGRSRNSHAEAGRVPGPPAEPCSPTCFPTRPTTRSDSDPRPPARLPPPAASLGRHLAMGQTLERARFCRPAPLVPRPHDKFSFCQAQCLQEPSFHSGLGQVITRSGT